MKKYILPICLAAAGLIAASCHKEDIKTYDDLTSLRYATFYSTNTSSLGDSISLSFTTHPNATYIDQPVVVSFSGVSDRAQTYKIGYVDSLTTAQPSDFTIPTDLTVAPGAVRDTFNLRLNYSSHLDEEDVRIYLTIEDDQEVKIGDYNRQFFIVHLNNMLDRPDWWTTTVANRYFGTYTVKKYRLYLSVIGVDLTDATTSLIRHYALMLKKYLAEQKAAGNTIYEDNGTEMTVPAI